MTSTTERLGRPGQIIGYHKNGRPIRLIAGGHTNPLTGLRGFRGRDDTQTLNSATFQFAGVNQDLNAFWSQNVDETFRVRFAVDETAGAAGIVTGQLEAQLNTGTFFNVTTTSTIVKAVVSAQYAHDDSTSDLNIGGTGTFLAGRGSEIGDTTDITLTSQHTEIEYAVQIVGADVANNDTITLRPAGLNTYAANPGPTITVVKITPNVVQVGFRGRDDTQALNSATFTQALNTNWSQNVDETFRVRFAVEENAGASLAIFGQIECSRNGGALQDVTTTSTIVKAVASAQYAHDDTTSDLAVGGAGAFVAGRGSETGDVIDVTLVNQHTECEYALQIVGADVANGDTIVIQIVAMNDRTQNPTITVVEAGGPQVDGDAALTATATFTATATVTGPTIEGDAALTAAAGLVATGVATRLASSNLTATASFTATATVTSVATATVSITATFTATGEIPTAWGPPSNLTATPISETQIDLEWDAMVGASGYDIERDGVVIATDMAGTTFSDTGLDAATEYDYRLRSVRT